MNIQEAFNLAIDKGYYTGDVKTSAMCSALSTMAFYGLITPDLRQSAVEGIETYMAHIVGVDDYLDSACSPFMSENLKKTGLPNGKEDLLKLYKDWDNRPNKQ